MRHNLYGGKSFKSRSDSAFERESTETLPDGDDRQVRRSSSSSFILYISSKSSGTYSRFFSWSSSCEVSRSFLKASTAPDSDNNPQVRNKA